MSDAKLHACVGSGHCCSRGLCGLAAAVHPRLPMATSCPELTWTGRGYRCGLVLRARSAAERQRIVRSLGIGEGCSHALAPKRLARARALGLIDAVE